MAFRVLAAAALLASSVVAKTDIAGCTSFDDVYTPAHGYPYATRIWYVPDTGELCEILDCGGGRAPPKTTVPGCAAYKGTETYSPNFINPATLGQAPLKASTTAPASIVISASAGTFLGSTTTTASGSDKAESSSSSSASASAHHTTSAATLSESASASSSASASTPTSSGSGSASSDNSASGSSTASSAAAASSSPTGAAAAPTAAMMGSCLIAGAAACLAML